VESSIWLIVAVLLVLVPVWSLFRVRVQAKAIRAQAAEIVRLREALSAPGRNSTQRAVIKGQIAEQFAPLLPGFEYNPKDFRFIGNPIDGIIVVGLTEAMEGLGGIHEIVLCDVKMGSARLSKHQQLIKRAVEQGRVRWQTIHVDRDFRVGRGR
jgi:hypothetical protein